MDRLITNNPLVAREFSGVCAMYYSDISLREVLLKVRDAIHGGHRLLTHPLSGSVKPNETPCKSVLISGEPDAAIDLNSLRIIEESIITCDKFPPKYPVIPPKVLADFREIDRTLIAGALCRHSSSI